MVEVKTVESWMRNNADDYETPTELAEAAADWLDIYEDEIDYEIPEWVFELALKYKDVE